MYIIYNVILSFDSRFIASLGNEKSQRDSKFKVQQILSNQANTLKEVAVLNQMSKYLCMSCTFCAPIQLAPQI